MKIKTLIESLSLSFLNPDITDKNFPYEESNAKVELFNAEKYVTSEEAIELMAEKGLRPATLTEMLKWAKENPELAFNSDYYVTALGSVAGVDGSRYVPYLGYWSDGRGLDLFWFEGRWGDGCRFAAVASNLVPLTPSPSGSLILSHLEILENEIKEIRKLL